MKLYAPTYYKNFKCIAGRCEHSCCIGWEIDIDADTAEKYSRLRDGYGAIVASSVSMEDTPHFKLGKNDRCPHLNEDGLCSIILHLGEEHLCDICREHPRFYNYTDVAEVGLGMSCPEAARVILAAPCYAEFALVGEVDANADPLDFNGRLHRAAIYDILSDAALDYAVRLDKLYRMYSVKTENDNHWLRLFGSLEYLNADHGALFMKYSSALRPASKQADVLLERFLAYLIYRHCTEASDADDFGARLAFCLLCERLLASLICTERAATLAVIATLASIISEEIEYSEDNTFTLMY